MPATPSARFPATAWTCIEAARDPYHPKYATAIDRLLTTYARPAYHYLRRKYPTAPDHEELTQQFFFNLVTRGWLARADSTRGRFRDFLKTLLKRFAYDQVVRTTERTRFEQRFVSLHSLRDEEGGRPSMSVAGRCTAVRFGGTNSAQALMVAPRHGARSGQPGGCAVESTTHPGNP